MSKRILLILSHSIEEHDQLKLLSSLGYEVFSLGGYINPHEPHDPKRPPLPDVPHFEDLHAIVDALNTDDNIGNAAAHIPNEILEWLGDDGVIICHHYLERIFGQWDHLQWWRQRGGRVIWRTVGQSTPDNERRAVPFAAEGLEIVRYSPKERNLPEFAGEDTLIRFYKDPEEWQGYTGDEEVVTNVTQHLVKRNPWTNAKFFFDATEGLPVAPAGDGSEFMPGGLGTLSLDDMKRLLRNARVYLYTGTQPASYTLGLLEALMTGIPVVSIGPSHMTLFPFDLFEGHELAGAGWSDDPNEASQLLEVLLDDQKTAQIVGQHQRWRTILEFGIDTVGEDWKAYLG